MKKTMVVFLALCLFVSSFVFSTTASEFKMGDVDKDGKISASDALFALQCAVNKIQLDYTGMLLADVDADRKISATDALCVLQYAVGKIKEFQAGETMSDGYYSRLDRDYGVTGENFVDVITLDSATDATELIDKLGAVGEAENVYGYAVDMDGKLIYNPITRELLKTGNYNKYKNASKETGTLKLGNAELTYSVPTDVTAYDAIPVEYSVYTTGGTRKPLHIEVNTFEEAARNDGNAYYDAAMPGDAKVQMEFLGYVTGEEAQENRPYHSGDFTEDYVSQQYPSYTTSELTYSADIPVTDLVWFKFRFTNIGDTILDSEGAGYYVMNSYLYKKNSSGTWDQVCPANNLRNTLYDYLYPGESGEMWLNFGDYYKPFKEGEYKIEINHMLRCPNSTAVNTGDGYNIGISAITFTVTEDGSDVEPEGMSNTYMGRTARNTWLSKYEEFMNSFDTLYELSDDPEKPTTGVIYVQPADFSESVTIKMMSASILDMASVCIPLNIDTESVKINLNPNNENYYVKEDGTRTPLIATQTMADMRVNTANGPDAENILFNQITDMKEAGINYFQTTLAGQFNVGSQTTNFSRYHGDAANYALALIREYGLKVEGVMSYPYNNGTLFDLAKRITGKDYAYNTFFSSTSLESVNAIFAKWAYTRWGDMYYTMPNGTVPIATEDTRAWLDHYNSFMYPISEDTIVGFRTWLKQKYATIEDYNDHHGTDYTSFDDINPLDDDTRADANHEFKNENANFHLWNDALMEFCLYKTVERVNNYSSILNQAEIENARINMRLEGSQWCVAGINSETDDPYLRRILYAQIYNSAVPEVIQASDTVVISSGYSNNNLAPSHVYELSKESSKQGIVNMQMGTFNRMRDYAINDRLGSNCGKLINTEDNIFISFIDTRTCVFTWFKAAYEGGSIPAILWQDYTCDGVVTVSQYKEMKFFKQKIDEMLNTEEGKKWATEFEGKSSTGLQGYESYDSEYIQSVIATEQRKSEFDSPYKKLS